MRVDAAERLIVALDVPRNEDRMIEVEDALSLVGELKGLVSLFKVGWPLYMAEGGHELPRRLIKAGLRVFLDLKFGDIAEAVKRLALVAARDGISFLSINASADAMRAIVSSRRGAEPKILALTLLSSLDQQDLQQMGINLTVKDFILYRAQQAQEAGCDGLIVSGSEIALVREKVGKNTLIVSPGIRPTNWPKHDHKRSATPEEAILAGADYIVVGRPITTADDPVKAAKNIVNEIHRGFNSRGW